MPRNQEAPRIDLDQEYVVAHEGVAGYYKGQKITLRHLPENLAKDAKAFARLLDLGALVPHGSREGKEIRDQFTETSLTPSNVPVLEDVDLPENPNVPVPGQESKPEVKPEAKPDVK